jgi:hypothetical protein
VGPAVVPGEDVADRAWPVGHGVIADLAAGNRQLGDGHRKAAGTWRAYHFHDASSLGMTWSLRCAPRACVRGCRAGWSCPADDRSRARVLLGRPALAVVKGGGGDSAEEVAVLAAAARKGAATARSPGSGACAIPDDRQLQQDYERSVRDAARADAAEQRRREQAAHEAGASAARALKGQLDSRLAELRTLLTSALAAPPGLTFAGAIRSLPAFSRCGESPGSGEDLSSASWQSWVRRSQGPGERHLRRNHDG